ncbi:Lrp/AsnC family transcriptional regulator [Halobacteriales archaeon Cl-PHB]
MIDPRPTLTPLDERLVDGLQRDFPVTERPFRQVAERFDADERRVHDRVRHLLETGIFRRFGPVLNPPVIGSSALVALSVPPERFESVAAVVNGHDAVNHNYRRRHGWNMWFVVTAPSRRHRDAILADIEAETGLETLVLPMRTQYYIGLEFPVVHDEPLARQPPDAASAVRPRHVETGGLDLTPLQARLVLVVQDGLPASRTPYRDLADDLGTSVAGVLDAIADLQDDYAIKRIGGVVNHHRMGFDANCMVVWNVPEAAVEDRGVAAGRHPAVTYACRRASRPEQDWPYTLFTMIHGRSRDAVEATVDDLAGSTLPDDHARLYTTASLKQTGVRYRDLVAGGEPA